MPFILQFIFCRFDRIPQIILGTAIISFFFFFPIAEAQNMSWERFTLMRAAATTSYNYNGTLPETLGRSADLLISRGYKHLRTIQENSSYAADVYGNMAT